MTFCFNFDWSKHVNKLLLKKIIKSFLQSLADIVLTQNAEFKLPDGSDSVSDIQDYIKFIIKKHETLRTIPPIHVYINIIINRLMIKIKDGYKLELQTPEIMKLFRSTKKLKDKIKKW